MVFRMKKNGLIEDDEAETLGPGIQRKAGTWRDEELSKPWYSSAQMQTPSER